MRRNLATLGPILSLAWSGLALGQGLPQGQEPEPPPPSPAPAPPAEVTPPAEAPEPAPELEPEAPPTETPAETQAQAAAPAHIAPAAESRKPPEVDEGSEPARSRDPWRDGHALGLEGSVGLAARIGSLQDGSGTEEHFDTAYQLGAWLTLGSEWALGLEFEHSGLGRVSSSNGPNSISAEYDVNYGWLGARAFPYRGDALELFVNLRLGIGFQSIDASGVRDQLPTTAAPDIFVCSVSDGPGFGLGAGVGAAYRLGSRVSLLARADGIGRRLTSDQVDGCAPGSGSVSSVNIGAGLLYVFDLGANAAIANAVTTPRF